MSCFFGEPDLEQLNYSLNTNTDIVLATNFGAALIICATVMKVYFLLIKM